MCVCDEWYQFDNSRTSLLNQTPSRDQQNHGKNIQAVVVSIRGQQGPKEEEIREEQKHQVSLPLHEDRPKENPLPKSNLTFLTVLVAFSSLHLPNVSRYQS